MPAPARRSARSRKANPRYANDGWSKETLKVLRTESQSSGSSPSEESDVPMDDSGQESIGTISDQDELDDAASVQSLDDATQDAFSMSEGELNQQKSQATRPKLQTSVNKTEIRSRGVAKVDRSRDYTLTYGSQVEDLAEVLSARDTWLKGRDITLPSRHTLLGVIGTSKISARDMGEAAVLNQDSREDLAARDEAIFTKFVQGQVTEPLSQESEIIKHMGNQTQSHSVVLGPQKHRQKYDIRGNCGFDFGHAWVKETQPSSNHGSHHPQASSGSRHHEGWIMNLSEKIQTLAWAPSAIDGPQFLAIATRCNPEQIKMTPGVMRHSPAFHPSPSYPSAIQFWRLETKDSSVSPVRTLDMDTRPSLALVVATEWGNIRQLAWRPLLDSDPPTTDVQRESNAPFHGILAVLSSDGHVRILAISLPFKPIDHVIPLRPQSLLWDISPSDGSIFTTLTFASPTDLALGTSTGEIHLYDLTSSPAQPYFSRRTHTTYIVSLCSTQSTQASLAPYLVSLSATGTLILTDLRSPDADTVSVHKSSFSRPASLVYSPLIHGFLTLSDSASSHTTAEPSSVINSYNLRSFHTSTRVARLPEDTGASTVLAASRWHPCILAGNARGDLYATNYLRKVLPLSRADMVKSTAKRKGSSRGAPGYLQLICSYEWRPLSKTELAERQSPLTDAAAASAAKDDSNNAQQPSLYNLYSDGATRQGVSRFTEGFLPVEIDVGHMPTNAQKPALKTGGGQDGAEIVGSTEIIFEEEQALTAIDWNPNRRAAGLAAVGWGSGVVRVQDLSHDYGRDEPEE